MTIPINMPVFLIVTIYRLPDNDILRNWTELSTLLERCVVSNSRLLLVGDFNILVEISTDGRARELA